MEKKCGWCGKKFNSKTKRAVFCSQKCKQAHYRARKSQITLPEVNMKVIEGGQSMGTKSLVLAVSQIKGGIATLDAMSKCGPKEYRLLCEVIAANLAEVLAEVGL